MRQHATLAPFLAVLSLLAACTTTGGASPAASPSAATAPSAASLDGHVYLSTSVTGHDLVAGSQVTINFKDGRMGASAGCNSMSADYQVVDGKLSLGMMAMTEMGCSDPLMAQDQWLAAFLPDSAISQAADTLTLSKDAVTMTLVDQQSTNLPLEGTTWTVDGLVSGDTASSVPQGVTATLVFGGGRVDVKAGCNTGSGSATIADGTITFGPIALTRKMCPEPAMAVEQQVTAVLQGSQPYAIAGDRLTLGASGKDGLVLKGGPAATAAPGAS